MPVELQRWWLWTNRGNGTLRPSRPVAPEELAKAVSSITPANSEALHPERDQHEHGLRLYLGAPPLPPWGGGCTRILLGGVRRRRGCHVPRVCLRLLLLLLGVWSLRCGVEGPILWRYWGAHGRCGLRSDLNK